MSRGGGSRCERRPVQSTIAADASSCSMPSPSCTPAVDPITLEPFQFQTDAGTRCVPSDNVFYPAE
jgi:hypothetical protein